MLEDLLPYFERELASLRELAAEFSERYPKVARRLQIGRDHCEDPHVERLLEAFAFLAARIHRKLDDDYPEIAQSFLQILHPDFLRPVPSATIVQLVQEPGSAGPRVRVPRHTALLSGPVQGTRCQFRTTADAELHPLRVARAGLTLTAASEHLSRTTTAAAAITVDLEPLERGGMEPPGPSGLRFFLDGDPALMALLYELLFFRLQEARASEPADPPRWSRTLPAGAVRCAGFGPAESLFGQDGRTFPGFRLLSEYFALPEKFLFLEASGLEGLPLEGGLRLTFLVSPYGTTERHLRLARTLCASTFRLGCVPAVNLFRHPGAPIRLDHRRFSYPVAADNRAPDAFEVHSIDAIRLLREEPSEEAACDVPPLHALRHGEAGPSRYYWHAVREPSRRLHDRGTDVEITLADLDFRPVRPGREVLSLELTCSNRDLPESLPFGGAARSQDAFSVPGHAQVRHAVPLRKPTASLRPPSGRGLQWRLVSLLCLNHLSLVSEGPGPLREALSLCDWTGSAAAARQIQGLAGVSARPATARVPGRASAAFVRGLEVRMDLDEACFVGGNFLLFAGVMERFLAHACHPNSFVNLSLGTLQQEGEVARWQNRLGDSPLI